MLILNDLFRLSDEEIKNSKIEFNMQAGVNGEAFLDRWLMSSNMDKLNGTCKGCSYWGWFGNKRNFRPGQVVFSFTRMPNDEWLFTSAARIIDTPEGDWAEVEVLDDYKSYFGRLIVKCKKGNTFARYVFNLSKYLESVVVKEILPAIYSGELFEGYDRVNLPYRKLADIFEGHISPTYFEALKKITGIYCLTDTNTGLLYIGSATGSEGVSQRWGDYLNSGHGKNKKLKALYQNEGKEYFEQHFTFTLLEYFGLSYDPSKIIEREQYWKKCLNTIKNGYNDN